MVKELFSNYDFHVVTNAVSSYKKVEVPFEIRYKLTKIALKKKTGLFVSDVEKKIGGINHAIRTVDYYLKKRCLFFSRRRCF